MLQWSPNKQGSYMSTFKLFNNLKIFGQFSYLKTSRDHKLIKDLFLYDNIEAKYENLTF